MKQLIRTLLLLAAFLAVVFGVNFVVDPANVFYHAYEETVSDILASGHSAAGVENMDDRRFLQLYAQKRTTALNTLILGSSRTMQITSAVTGDPNSFVAGVTGSDLRDCISAYFLFEKAGFDPSTVVLSLEFWYLSRGNLDSRALTDGYNEFCRQQEITPVKTGSAQLSKLKNFFSFPYFQSSVEYLAKGRKKTLPSETDEKYAELAVKRPDGSYGYEKALREASQTEVDRHAADKRVADNLAAGFTHVDENLCAALKAFVQYLTSEGKEVRILLSPVHPDYYALMLEQPETYQIVFEAQRYYHALGEAYKVPVYGSYDPAALGITNADFYDEIHPTEQALMGYYNLCVKN